MDPKILKQLEEAKAHFYAWRLLEAYNILRRFFDRLPFQMESEHAEYVSMFARILCELGKERELLFYVGELEKWHERSQDPHIVYTLAVIYRFLPEPRWERTKALLESLLLSNASRSMMAKARMLLAAYYSNRSDTGACRHLIDGIEPPDDPHLARLVIIWRAYVYRLEGNLQAAKKTLQELSVDNCLEEDWYAYFSAQITLAQVYIEERQFLPARKILSELTERFSKRKFKTLLAQLADAEAMLAARMRETELELHIGPHENTLSAAGRRRVLKKSSPRELLLMLLIEYETLPKEAIIRELYDRDYEGKKDDKLIYYHMHSLRKDLEHLGIQADAITFDKQGYRLTVAVNIIRGQNESHTN